MDHQESTRRQTTHLSQRLGTDRTIPPLVGSHSSLCIRYTHYTLILIAETVPTRKAANAHKEDKKPSIPRRRTIPAPVPAPIILCMGGVDVVSLDYPSRFLSPATTTNTTVTPIPPNNEDDNKVFLQSDGSISSMTSLSSYHKPITTSATSSSRQSSSRTPYTSRMQQRNHDDDAPWRRYGQERRKFLIEQDDVFFRMNAACAIAKYFGLVDRVLHQFRLLRDDHRTEDAYVMGHRWMTFCRDVLPRHPHYGIVQHVSDREAVRRDLEWMLQDQLPTLSTAIDEAQLERHMDHEFDAPIDDEDDDDDDDWVRPGHMVDKLANGTDDSQRTCATETTTLSGSSDSNGSSQMGWEAFDGWCNEAPRPVETDASSSQSHETDPDGWLPHSLDDSFSSSSCSESSQNGHLELALDGLVHTRVVAVGDPDLFSIDSDEDSDDDMHRHGLLGAFQTPRHHGHSFLQHIASQSVQFETDSEAADSWATDAPSQVTASSATDAFTCDPARLAFRNIMTRHKALQKKAAARKQTMSSQDNITPSSKELRGVVSRSTLSLEELELAVDATLTVDLAAAPDTSRHAVSEYVSLAQLHQDMEVSAAQTHRSPESSSSAFGWADDDSRDRTSPVPLGGFVSLEHLDTSLPKLEMRAPANSPETVPLHMGSASLSSLNRPAPLPLAS